MSKIILTGGSGYIGQHIAADLHNRGHRVVVTDISSDGVDMLDEANVEEFFREHESDYLVNMFGYNHHIGREESPATNFMEIDADELSTFNDINVKATFIACRAFMKCNDKNIGIINTASLYGLRAPKAPLYNDQKHVGYVTSKHAVIGLTKYIATHFAPRVRTNVICPGGVWNSSVDPEFVDRYNDHVPMGRMAKREDLCGIINLLCSDESSYINGAVIPIDGGWTAW